MPASVKRFDNRTVVVTGGARGMGASALLFARVCMLQSLLSIGSFIRLL